MSRRTVSFEDAPAFESNRTRRAEVGTFAKREQRAASGVKRREDRAKSSSRKGWSA